DGLEVIANDRAAQDVRGPREDRTAADRAADIRPAVRGRLIVGDDAVDDRGHYVAVDEDRAAARRSAVHRSVRIDLVEYHRGTLDDEVAEADGPENRPAIAGRFDDGTVANRQVPQNHVVVVDRDAEDAMPGNSGL